MTPDKLFGSAVVPVHRQTLYMPDNFCHVLGDFFVYKLGVATLPHRLIFC